MVNDRIVAWLKLRDVARFVRDAKLAEYSIKEIAQAAKDGEGPLGALGGALSSLQGVLPKARTETGILGLTLGSLITVVIAGTPLIVGLGGAVVALAGSLGAAALGAGALTTSLIGAALPLGAFGLVAMQAFKGFTKVNTAFQQWQVQVGHFGRYSTQAQTALGRLNAIAAQFGGDTMVKLAQKWSDFQNSFRKANSGAIQSLIKLFNIFLDTATKLLPFFSVLTQTVGQLLVDAFQKLSAVLTSSGTLTFLSQMLHVFSGLAGPLGQTVINLFKGLMNIAVKAAPALSWFADQLLRASQGFLNWTRGGGVGGVIAQFQSWWNLLKAVGGLLITILSGGSKEGKSLVDSLTAIVNKWNDWLNTAHGQNSLAKFFRDAGAMTKQFVSILAGVIAFFFKFGRALMPIYTVVFKALRDGWHQFMSALKPFKPFWTNVLEPILKGIVEGVVGSVVGAFKFLIIVMKVLGPVFGWLGRAAAPLKGFFEIVGKVIGFVFGGAILKVLGSLGKLTFLLRPLGAIFRILELPIRMMTGVMGFLAGKAEVVIGVLGKFASKFGFVRTAVNAVLDWLTGAGAKFFDAGIWLWNRLRAGITRAIGQGIGFAADIGKAVYNFVARLINKGIPNHLGPIDLPNNPIPMLAMGGVVSGSGSWITGDAGPEINTLRNGRVTVVPLSPAVSAQSASATLAPSEKRVLVSKIYLKGKQIAEAVADEAEDEAARR